MKKILSERNLVVVLFIAALTVFSFAQEDAKKAEKLNHNVVSSHSLLPSAQQSANNTPAADKTVVPPAK